VETGGAILLYYCIGQSSAYSPIESITRMPGQQPHTRSSSMMIGACAGTHTQHSMRRQSILGAGQQASSCSAKKHVRCAPNNRALPYFMAIRTRRSNRGARGPVINSNCLKIGSRAGNSTHGKDIIVGERGFVSIKLAKHKESKGIKMSLRLNPCGLAAIRARYGREGFPVIIATGKPDVS
jgi:hypothetical protein